MTWTRLSDDHADRPDLLAASRSARHLHTEALIYGNRHGNDGRFRRTLVARMTDAEDWSDLVDELLALGIWLDHGAGDLEIEWARWGQEPAKEVKERKETNAERQRLYRERGRLHSTGDHSLCTSRCPSRDPSRSESRNGSRDATPSRPVPSGGKGRDGQAGTAGSAGAPPAGGQSNGGYVPHDVPDDVEFGEPCPICGLGHMHLVHWACVFVPDPEVTTHCLDCGEPVNSDNHAAHVDYLAARDEGLPWIPAGSESERATG